MGPKTLEKLSICVIVVSLPSCVWLFETPLDGRPHGRHHATWSLPKFMSIESVMASNHLILCHPLLLLPSIFPSIRVFSNESAVHIRWPKYWSFSISPSKEYSGSISFKIDWFDLFAVQGTLEVFSSTTVQKHQFFGAQPSLYYTLTLQILPSALTLQCSRYCYISMWY